MDHKVKTEPPCLGRGQQFVDGRRVKSPELRCQLNRTGSLDGDIRR